MRSWRLLFSANGTAAHCGIAAFSQLRKSAHGRFCSSYATEPRSASGGRATVAYIRRRFTVWGSAPQVMLGNLVNNAVLYTPSEGRVLISASRSDQSIVVQVADNGIGIALKDRERVFDRFYRVSGTGESGSGLGLSIVQSIAKAYAIDIT
jgi:C4-dicarboxylate-specific signal transduction histidine kinase